MVDPIQYITIGSTIVLIIGGIYTLRQQIRKSKEDSEKRIIEAIQKEVQPIQITVNKDRELFISNLNEKEKSINDLWKDLEKLEDDLNKLQINVSKT